MGLVGCLQVEKERATYRRLGHEGDAQSLIILQLMQRLEAQVTLFCFLCSGKW
jgi:hypothetical protein